MVNRMIRGKERKQRNLIEVKPWAKKVFFRDFFSFACRVRKRKRQGDKRICTK